MEPMEDQNDEADFQIIDNSNHSAEDLYFDNVMMNLQEIVLDGEFEKKLGLFMKNNWKHVEQGAQLQKEIQIFQVYKQEVQTYLHNKISERMDNFKWELFWQLFPQRKDQIDEQLLDTLLSLQDVQNFRSFIKDYKHSYEEEEMLKVLTIKSNKISENKKVKGKDNIFGGADNPMFGGDNKLKPLTKKKSAQEKTEEELLVPQLILTVKPMRKG